MIEAGGLRAKVVRRAALAALAAGLGALWACGDDAAPGVDAADDADGPATTTTTSATDTGPRPDVVTTPTSAWFDLGEPTVVDLWVGAGGSDDATGTSRDAPLKTLGAAFGRAREVTSTGARVNVLPGELPCEGDCMNAFGNLHGTLERPIIVRAADGPGTATLLGGINLAEVSHVYVLDLTLRAGGEAPMWGNNVLHCEACDTVVFRGLTVAGPYRIDAAERDEGIQEAIKINQATGVYIEGCEVYGSAQTAIDFVSVQGGHILDSAIHDAGEWGIYPKGGSAYVVIAGNDITRCGLGGFEAGEGSNLEILESPWIHYEAYDIRFVNNVVHDMDGHGAAVAGGYNILIAFNTFYRVGLDLGGKFLFDADFGGRVCMDFEENGVGNGAAICGAKLDAGGFGLVGDPARGYDNGGPFIPSRNVYVYGNVFYNPAPHHTQWAQLAVYGARDVPAGWRNVGARVSVDTNLRFVGNIIWNGSLEAQPLGVGGEDQGCQDSNPTCNVAQLMADNRFNAVEPALVDPAHGDFRPVPGGSVAAAATPEIPDFTWDDRPMAPEVPIGSTDNRVPTNRAGEVRADRHPGAY